MTIFIITTAVLFITTFWGWWKYKSLQQLLGILREKLRHSEEDGDFMKIEEIPDTDLTEITQIINELIKTKNENLNLVKEFQKQGKSTEDIDLKIKEIEKSISRITVLSDAGKKITSSLNIEEIIENIFEFVSSVVSIFEIEIFIKSEDKFTLLIHGNNGEKKVNNISYDSIPEILKWCDSNSQEVILNHAASDFKRYISQPIDDYSGIQPKSLICMPLVHQRHTIGAMGVYASEPNIFDKYHEEIIRSLSSFVSVAIDNSNIYQILELNKTEIELEKTKSDNLLLNILPSDVAQELKETGTSKARLFNDVTVLFSDFVNFTSISEKMSPAELVDELHECFKAFDAISDKYHLEKIKTIGDAYLAATGLPNPDENHASQMVEAAKEMIMFMRDREKTGTSKLFSVRIGINSGPVVAGIVGNTKFAYDIWGDTVNTAARMEQNSSPGKINISGPTYNLVKDKFETEYRGKVNAKNKGEIDMYFVKVSD